MQNDVILRSGVTVLSQGQHVQGPAPSDPFLSRPPLPFLAMHRVETRSSRRRSRESVSLSLFLTTPCPSFSLEILVREASLVFFVIRANKVHCR